MKGQITMLGVIIAGICLLIVMYTAPVIDLVFNKLKTGNSFIDSVAGTAVPIIFILLPVIFLILTTTRQQQ